MPRVGKRVACALVCSSLSSVAYLALALYQLFEIAEQDKLMFILLVSFTVEVVFWSAYLLRMFCSFNTNGKSHLNRTTLPHWDTQFVLILTVVGVQLQQIDGVFWWQIEELSLYAQITIIAVLVALPLKIISNAILSEYFHRGCVRGGLAVEYSGPAYNDFEQSLPLTALSPNAPPEDNECY